MSLRRRDNGINRARLLMFYIRFGERVRDGLSDSKSCILIMLIRYDADDIRLILLSAGAFKALLGNTWTTSAHPTGYPDDAPSRWVILHRQLDAVADLHIWHGLANRRRQNN